MKTLLLALIANFLFNSSILADTAITDETALNQKLLENSTLSKKYQEEADSKKQKTEIRAFSPTQNLNEMNLTDQEKQLSENYVHQGKANQILEEKCAGDNAAMCAGQAGKSKFLGVDSKMLAMASKAYAMFGAMTDGLQISAGKNHANTKEAAEKAKSEQAEKPDANSKETSATDSKKTEKKEKASDYCRYIPVLTEGLATAQQMSASASASDAVASSDSKQSDVLYVAAKSHDTRSKQAQIQAAGWFGGAACYAGMLATGQYAFDWKLGVKMGAATFLGAFYQNEVKVNKAYADETRKIADSLPGKGDCNPITDKLCYCSQPSTENDPTYCATTLHKTKIAQDSYRVACTDQNLKIDAQCKCVETNSCFDRTLENMSGGDIGLGLSAHSSPYKGIRALARGELLGSNLNDSAFNKTAAIAKNALRNVANKIEKNGLNKAQSAEAALLEENGIPSAVSNLMARQNPSSAQLSAASAKLGGASGMMAAVSPQTGTRSNVISFGGGNGLGTKGKKSNSKDSDNDLLNQLKGKTAKKANNSNVLEFAMKAEAQAKKANQIRRDDTPLFDIISMRYQTTARRLLDIKEEEN